MSMETEEDEGSFYPQWSEGTQIISYIGVGIMGSYELKIEIKFDPTKSQRTYMPVSRVIQYDIAKGTKSVLSILERLESDY